MTDKKMPFLHPGRVQVPKPGLWSPWGHRTALYERESFFFYKTGAMVLVWVKEHFLFLDIFKNRFYLISVKNNKMNNQGNTFLVRGN